MAIVKQSLTSDNSAISPPGWRQLIQAFCYLALALLACHYGFWWLEGEWRLAGYLTPTPAHLDGLLAWLGQLA